MSRKWKGLSFRSSAELQCDVYVYMSVSVNLFRITMRISKGSHYKIWKDEIWKELVLRVLNKWNHLHFINNHVFIQPEPQLHVKRLLWAVSWRMCRNTLIQDHYPFSDGLKIKEVVLLLLSTKITPRHYLLNANEGNRQKYSVKN